MNIDAIAAAIVGNRRTHDAKAQAIQKDRNLSNEGKMAQLRALFAQAQATHRTLLAEYRGELEGEAAKLRGRAFAVRDDQKAEYRQCLAEAAKAKGQEELVRLLERANTTRDDLMARAVVTIAQERGARGVIAEAEPRDPDLRAYLDFERAHGEARSAAAKFDERILLSSPRWIDGRMDAPPAPEQPRQFIGDRGGSGIRD